MNETTPGPAVASDEEILPPPPSTPPKPDEQAPEEQPAEEAQAEDTEAAEEEDEEEQPKKSKTSGYARLKARHQRLLAEVEAQKAAQQQPPQPKEPRIEDFNGDYLAFEKAAVAFSAERAVERALAKQQQQAAQVQEATAKHEVIEDFFERTETFKAKVKDFDPVIDAMYGQFGALPVPIRDKIAEADNGPQILYFLAKNPGAARELYEAGPLDGLYQIGRLDEKLSLPSARKETKAPPPIHSPRGGAAPPKDFFQLASKSEDISDYVRARRKDVRPED